MYVAYGSAPSSAHTALRAAHLSRRRLTVLMHAGEPDTSGGADPPPLLKPFVQRDFTGPAALYNGGMHGRRYVRNVLLNAAGRSRLCEFCTG